ncbi:MAG: hypothetical protein J6Y29_02525 [Clostridiales bacterium]|nr:hypothetical protein [Clostridiales bacterium]
MALDMSKLKSLIGKNGLEDEKRKLKGKADRFEDSFKGEYGYSRIRKWTGEFRKEIREAKSKKKLKELEIKLEDKLMDERSKEAKMTIKASGIKKDISQISDLSRSNETLVGNSLSETGETISINSRSNRSSISDITYTSSNKNLNKNAKKSEKDIDM